MSVISSLDDSCIRLWLNHFGLKSNLRRNIAENELIKISNFLIDGMIDTHHTHTHTNNNTHTHTHTNKNTLTHTHTNTHTQGATSDLINIDNTHTHTHTHTHT
eukprot:GHVR01055852.1.p1 GENE.GHVR01055852.1~~GHVR01055852.1.p1  ORF type:complete len:103 (+),score=72.28 GHVR01055852.1:120-428(+)